MRIFKKIFAIMALTAFVFPSQLIAPIQAQAATAPSDIFMSSDYKNARVDQTGTISKLIVSQSGEYSFYPRSVWVNDYQTNVKKDVKLRNSCTDGRPTEMPWVAYYPPTNNPTNVEANNFYTAETGCADRETNGGSGHWLPVEWNNWALPSSLAVDTVNWKPPVFTTSLQSGQFHDVTGFTGVAAKAIWKNDIGPITDSESWVNGKYTHTNSSGVVDCNALTTCWGELSEPGKATGSEAYALKLTSSGTSLFRQEFKLSTEQINFIKNANSGNVSLTIKAQADDFQKIYLNGQPLIGGEATTISEGTGKAVNLSITLSKAQLSSYLVEGDNVLAFQVVDKAVWYQNLDATSNATGLSFDASLDFTAPVVIPSCSATVNPNPANGQSPFVVMVSASVQNFIGNPTFSFDMGDGTAAAQRVDTTPINPLVYYYTYNAASNPTYTVAVRETTSNLTCTVTPATVTVTAPTDNTGGEVSP
jgi:hypothetical protein